ncbi:NBS-LRR type resistance protein [Cucumis melo var. makuwa]|uniref:NBS-LRR type resistance protein n=1 Tax=Cucumis melo var. makuwa TaxID=1194695 RepID=A0A5A7T7L5_CUCMM|nr:NBS-LRR type resistance protein [Cucumis melo var. makuwa]
MDVKRDREKGSSTPLASHFRLSLSQCPVTEQERSDLGYAMSMISRFMSNSGKEHRKVVKWVLRYLKSSGSVERTYQSSAPEGCTYQSSAPEGYTYQSSAPEGCTYQSSAPEGCTYQSSAPEGCTYQSSAPEGCTYQYSAPEGCTYP